MSEAEKKESLSKEELAEIYATTIKALEEGSIVKGKIVDVRNNDVIVDIGYKAEGFLSRAEFVDPAGIKIGAEIDVYIDAIENEQGMVVLSKLKADRALGWERIVENYKEGDLIEGRVVRKVKGGFMVDIGVEAFLPASLSGAKGPTVMDRLVGQTLKFRIVKMNKPRRNVIVSRKDVVLLEKEEAKKKMLESMKEGEIRPGIVKNITDYGAFIDLGGVDGLLHITDMTWGRISHPSEMLALGDKIEVVILNVDKENNKVSLGLKQKTENPWKEVERKFPVGSRVKGKIVNIVPYGAFVELEKGVEGLIHISEFSWTKKIHDPHELVAIGDMVEVIVLGVDVENKKISLSIKQLEQDPWTKVVNDFPVGTRVKGKIKHITDYGAFVELEEGIEGMIHISDISWTRRLKNPAEVLKKGEKVEAVVLSLDQENRRVNLGIKQLIPDPWPQLMEKFKIGSVMEGKITRITNFGVFVELSPELEGLVHISEIDPTLANKLEEVYKIGDKIKVKIIKIEQEKRQVGLSTRLTSEEA
ncbi:MAG: 30S ribosomal protein S1 [Candidatus Omnitrophica bacterium]|nr:30S ribosomal protein S1 [Candidatus Omnitrophota bacterium]MCM8799011.1 30S ribosomal protein S1 [Candidatus Omnitrophota bacterium]